jgi:hypothetical protein
MSLLEVAFHNRWPSLPAPEVAAYPIGLSACRQVKVLGCSRGELVWFVAAANFCPPIAPDNICKCEFSFTSIYRKYDRSAVSASSCSATTPARAAAVRPAAPSRRVVVGPAGNATPPPLIIDLEPERVVVQRAGELLRIHPLRRLQPDPRLVHEHPQQVAGQQQHQVPARADGGAAAEGDQRPLTGRPDPRPRRDRYAGIPPTTPEGHVLGSFCVIDHEPRRLHQLLDRVLVVGRDVIPIGASYRDALLARFPTL